MATTIKVSNAAQLTLAIKLAKGGETILLASGDYGDILIKSRTMTSTVTIKSADPDHDASITGLRINLSSGFRFEDIDLHRPLVAGESLATQAAYISGSSNIAIVGINFTGSMDGNAANDGTGLRITGSQGVSITGSTFEQWSHAVVLSDDSGLTVSGNSLKNVGEGFNLATLQDASFTGNHLTGVKQDWKTSALAGHNVVVSGNILDSVAAAGTGPGAQIHVTNAVQLTAALKAVTGGETILLASGDYGAVSILSRNLLSQVTIKSEDSSHDATIGSLRINNSSNLRFEDLDIHRPLVAGEAEWTTAVDISSSSKIAMIGLDFTGSMDGNSWNDGVGLKLSEVHDVSLIDSTFAQWTNAAVFTKSTDLLIVGNTVTDVREGFDFSAITNATIAQNLFTAFSANYAAGDHSDAIQFWTAGVAQGSSHIVIRDNAIIQGPTGGVQGIFISTQDPAYRFSDFDIENNLYYGDARHGITLSGTDGAIVRGNTVITAPGGKLEAGINVSDTTNALVDHNISPLLLFAGTNVGLVTNANIDIYDTAQRQGIAISQLFDVTPATIDLTDFVVKSGSAAATAHAGFTALSGIGAGEFDMAVLSTHGHVQGLLANFTMLA